MSWPYRIMYAVGFTPWVHAEVPDKLRELVTRLSPCRALDVGCGTGTEAIWLAQRGFQVVGVDVVPKAIARARRRAAEIGVTVDFHVADAASMNGEVPGPFSLILDSGCMLSVPGPVRDRLTRACTDLAAPGASFLLLTFAPRRGPGPKGLGREEIERRFARHWDVVETVPDDSLPLPRFLRDASPSWYWLKRRSAAQTATTASSQGLERRA